MQRNKVTPIFGDFWDIKNWPPSIYPHTPSRARYYVNANRDALTKFGALRREGRELLIVGDVWRKWLLRPQTLKAVNDEAPGIRAALAKRLEGAT